MERHGHEGINNKRDPLQWRSAWKINGGVAEAVSGFEKGNRVSAIAIRPNKNKIAKPTNIYFEEAPTDSDKKRELKEKIVKTLKENKEVPKPTIH